MIHSNKRFQPNCLGELSLVPKSCWWGPLLLIACSSQGLGLTAQQKGRELHFFPTLSVISLCAKQEEQNHKSLEFRNPTESWLLWSSWKHQPFLLFFTSFAETIKLIKIFIEEVFKFSSYILYQLRLIPFATNKSNEKTEHIYQRGHCLPPLFPILWISEVSIIRVHCAVNQDDKRTNSRRATALMCK